MRQTMWKSPTRRLAPWAGVLALGLSVGLPVAAFGDDATSAVTEARPQTPQPSAQPPAPSQGSGTSSVKGAPANPRSDGTLPPGQWVYTQQYGWTWMPYAQSYVLYPPAGGVPLMYVYTSGGGWAWVDAPWIVGIGPRPFFTVWLERWPFAWGWRYGHVWHPRLGPRWHRAFPLRHRSRHR